MIKPILFSSAIFLLVSCGNSSSKPAEQPTPSPTQEVVKEEVDGTVTSPDTLPEEKPVVEEKKETKPTLTKPSKTEGKASDEKQATKPGKPSIHGSWALEKVYGAKEPFNMLFPNKIPNITFDLKENTVSGNNGCNSYNGPFELKNGKLTIGNMMSTRMYCEGVKEQLYMTTLKMTTAYKFEGNKMILLLDEEPILGFIPAK